MNNYILTSTILFLFVCKSLHADIHAFDQQLEDMLLHKKEIIEESNIYIKSCYKKREKIEKCYMQYYRQALNDYQTLYNLCSYFMNTLDEQDRLEDDQEYKNMVIQLIVTRKNIIACYA